MAKTPSIQIDIVPNIDWEDIEFSLRGLPIQWETYDGTSTNGPEFNNTAPSEEEDTDSMSMDEQLQELRERYLSAETASDYNAIWEEGKRLGLEHEGRVTIPAASGEKRTESREGEQDPTDFAGRQVRVTREAEVELRQDEEDDGKASFRLHGYAAKFNRETVIGWFFKWREKIAPGAFTKTIQEADVRHLFNHDPNWVLGRNKSGTLRLSEDSIGLIYDVDLNMNDPQAVSVKEKVDRGDVSQSSFAFIILRELFEEPDDPDGGELPLRTILEAKLFDTSSVTYPAYEDTTALISSGVRDAAAKRLGLELELMDMIANERLTPDSAVALRGIAHAAEELAAACEDGEPCPRAAEKAPADGNGNEPAAEDAPDGSEGTDREVERDKTILLGDHDARNAELKALLADIPVNQEV